MCCRRATSTAWAWSCMSCSAASRRFAGLPRMCCSTRFIFDRLRPVPSLPSPTTIGRHLPEGPGQEPGPALHRLPALGRRPAALASWRDSSGLPPRLGSSCVTITTRRRLLRSTHARRPNCIMCFEEGAAPCRPAGAPPHSTCGDEFGVSLDFYRFVDGFGKPGRRGIAHCTGQMWNPPRQVGGISQIPQIPFPSL